MGRTIEIETISTDEAAKIFSEIRTLSPLMRSKASAKYIGREVDWTAEFFSGEMETKKRAFLAFRHEASDKMIFTHANLADYPWLQSMQRGELVQLRGRISKVGPVSIDLETLSLTPVARIAEKVR